MDKPSQRHMRFRRLGRYELLEELGRDGDGIVYKARDPLLGRLVAIKTVRRNGSADESGNPDFERKARLAGRLSHPNIVSVYDAGTSRDVAYIASELIDGEPLRDMLDSGTALPAVAIERIAAQVADGLDFTHRHALVHGDVNPSAILVLNIGFVKISCLGNALFPAGSPAPEDRIVALSRYASPERVMGVAIDARSDVFSLGVVLYEMLTGNAPFSGSTPREVIDAITNDHPSPPSSLNRGIPSGFDYIVARALSKEPNHRYQSARDMAVDLRKWALEEPTFFTMPRPSMAPAQTTHAEPLRIAAPREFGAAGPVLNAAATDESRPSPRGLLTRRQWLLYGIPGALLTLSGAWTLWSRPTPTLRPNTTTLGSAIANVPTTAPPELPRVRAELPPSTAPTEAEPAIEPTRARTLARPAVAQLKLAVSPWGEIYVNGRKRGVSPPLTQIELAPGKHRIEIRNTVFPPRSEFVEVKANARLRIKHKFSS